MKSFCRNKGIVLILVRHVIHSTSRFFEPVQDDFHHGFSRMTDKADDSVVL